MAALRLPLASCSTARSVALRTAATFYPGERAFDGRNEALPLGTLKPRSPFHYTGEPAVQDVIDVIRATGHDVRRRMVDAGLSERVEASNEDVFTRLGLEKDAITVPACTWHTAYDMSRQMASPVSEEQRSRIITELERLHGLLGPAALYDRMIETNEESVVRRIVSALAPYVLGRAQSRADLKAHIGDKPLAVVDDWGRIAARGRSKSARATAWIIRTRSMPETSAPVGVATPDDANDDLEAFADRVRGEPATETPEEDEAADGPAHPSTADVPAPLRMYGLSAEPSIGRILINNRPIVHAMPDLFDRNVVLEPFALTQTLGEYNVFAIVTQGGRASRARAVAHAIARCLFEAEGATAKQVLINAGLLLTDPRVHMRSMPNRRGNRGGRPAAGHPGRKKRLFLKKGGRRF